MICTDIQKLTHMQEGVEGNQLISFKPSNFSGYTICTAGFGASSAPCPHFYLHVSFDSQNKQLLFSKQNSPVGLADSIALLSL
jgi:hypothetical protein